MVNTKLLNKASSLPVGTEPSTDLAKERDEVEEGELEAPEESCC